MTIPQSPQRPSPWCPRSRICQPVRHISHPDSNYPTSRHQIYRQQGSTSTDTRHPGGTQMPQMKTPHQAPPYSPGSNICTYQTLNPHRPVLAPTLYANLKALHSYFAMSPGFTILQQREPPGRSRDWSHLTVLSLTIETLECFPGQPFQAAE